MITENLQLGLKSKYLGLVGLFLILYVSTLQGQSPVSISATTIDATVASTIQGHLNSGTSVIVISSGSITVNNGVSILKSAGTDATLTFKANFRVTMNINTSIKSTSAKLNLVFWSNATNLAGTKGMIRFGDHTQVGANVVVETNGGHVWMGGGANDVSWNGLTVGDGYAWGSSNPGGNGWYGIELYGDCRFITSGGDISLNGRSTDQTYGQGATFGIFIIKSIFNSGSGNITTNTLTDGTSPASGTSTGIGIAGDGGFTTTTGNITITNAINAQGNTTGSATGIYLERNSSGNMSGNPVITSNQGNVTIATTFTSPATQKWYIDLNELNFLREKSTSASDFTEPLREIFDNSTSSYSSSATGVATVTNAGLVSIVGVGTTDITGVLSRNDWNSIDSRWMYRINVVNKADPDLTFAQSEVFKQPNDGNFTLSATQQNQNLGTLGTISYTSSNRSVATVNSATGEVTLVGEGSTVITATSASTATYAQGNANYTLYVTNGLVVFTTSAIANNDVVTVAGNVVSDGGSAITERGFVYSSNINPTIADNKVTVAGTTGTFSGSTPNLGGGTFFFRAYATNNNGTVYGSEISLNIVGSVIWVGGVSNDWNDAANWNPNVVPTALIDAEIPTVIQGNVYPVVPVGVNAATKNLTVSSSGVAESIQVEDGATLTIHGTYTVSDGAGVKVMGSQIIP